MLDIDEMSQQEIHSFLQKINYGHLGYIHEGKPYVMPMHYYLEGSVIYLLTTVGMKTHDIDLNPEICLQVEEIQDSLHWRSVIVRGLAETITEKQEIDRIIHLVKEINPTLSPAINRTWIDAWGRAEVVVIYQIQPREMTGRTTDGISNTTNL